MKPVFLLWSGEAWRCAVCEADLFEISSAGTAWSAFSRRCARAERAEEGEQQLPRTEVIGTRNRHSAEKF